MTVCSHRPEACGSFTPCRPCLCGQEVIAELIAQSTTEDQEALEVGQ